MIFTDYETVNHKKIYDLIKKKLKKLVILIQQVSNQSTWAISFIRPRKTNLCNQNQIFTLATETRKSMLDINMKNIEIKYVKNKIKDII